MVAVVYAGIIASIFPSWLRPYYQPQRGGPELSLRAGDLTPLFSVWCQISARYLFERGAWPLWSDHIYCGEPFFAKPQIGVISLTTLLCLVLPAQVAATWTFLLHLWIAGMATYGWHLHILNRTHTDSNTTHLSARADGSATQDVGPGAALGLPAACGGIAFMLSGLMVEHAMIGHGPIVLVACWTPLILWLLDRALVAPRPVRSAAMAGALVAIQLLAGGETVFLYNAVAGALLAIAWLAVGGQWGDSIGQVSQHRLLAAKGDESGASAGQTNPNRRSLRWLRVVFVGAVVGLVGFGLSAAKVLPGLALMAVSNRCGGLSLKDAGGFVTEFTEPAVLNVFSGGLTALRDVRHLFGLTLTLSAVGVIFGLHQRSLRWYILAALLLVAAGVLIAHSSAIFALLWHLLPMFRYQRIPQRALILAYLGLSLLVSIGARRLMFSGLVRPGARWLVGSVLLLAIAGETWLAIPPLPPSADIRQEVRENSILNYVARQPGRFRIHAIESTDRNWGIEHVTVPLGLSNLAGWDHLWLLEYLGAEGPTGRDVRPFLSASYEARHPARYWGMMNVRFITSTRQVQLPGLQFVSKFPVSHRSQPAKSAGPYLYENTECLERVWIVPNAILVLGERAERMEAVYRLLDHADFNPRRIVVIHSDQSVAELSDELANYQAVAVPARWASAETVQAIERAQCRLLTYTMQDSDRGRLFQWGDPEPLAAVLSPSTETAPSGDARDGSFDVGEEQCEYENSTVYRVSLPRRSGFLVLAEKFAHFPGWHAETDHGPHALLRANGVASAVRLDGLESWIALRYWPAGFTVGLCITLTSLLLATLFGWFGDRLVRF